MTYERLVYEHEISSSPRVKNCSPRTTRNFSTVVSDRILIRLLSWEKGSFFFAGATRNEVRSSRRLDACKFSGHRKLEYCNSADFRVVDLFPDLLHSTVIVEPNILYYKYIIYILRSLEVCEHQVTRIHWLTLSLPPQRTSCFDHEEFGEMKSHEKISIESSVFGVRLQC